MGRLFWKFFTVFWIAQFATFLVTGVMFVARPSNMANFPDRPPMSQRSVPDGLDQVNPRRPDGRLPPPPMLIAALLVSLAFAAWLSWYFSRPIRTLNTAFEALADGKLDTRVGIAMGSRRDELSDLGKAFDRSAAKLQAQVEAQRRLLHDVSHELRSPLARLQACSDLLIQQPDRAAELVKRVERETSRMDALVGELLTLARLDSGVQQKRTEWIDLSEVVHNLCVDAQLELESKQCALDVDVQVGVTLQGDGELLYRALDNILRKCNPVYACWRTHCGQLAPGHSDIAGDRYHRRLRPGVVGPRSRCHFRAVFSERAGTGPSGAQRWPRLWSGLGDHSQHHPLTRRHRRSAQPSGRWSGNAS